MSTYLGPSCLTYLWNKIKTVFAEKDDIPDTLSDLDNDVGYIKPEEITDVTDIADLEISDESNNPILKLKNGHIKTKYFDSEVTFADVSKFVSISQSDYDALSTKDSTTLYLITS